MIVRYTHPAHGVVESEIPTICPNCACAFEPAENELQSAVDAPVTVHCVDCGTLALQWSPPPPPPDNPPGDPNEPVEYG